MLKPLYLILLFALFTVGCNGMSGSDFSGTLVPVAGSVLVDGEATGGVKLTFVPVDGTNGTGGFATTSDLGSFNVEHRSGQPGIEAGQYKVICSHVTKADGSPVGPEEDAAIVGQEQLPAEYLMFETTPVTVEVTPQGKELMVEIETSGS